jgi:large subunit ribosomal protein L15
MQHNTISRPSSLKRPYRRVGRGQSSTRGKQSGRGGKGQTARAGNKRRPEWRDIIKKLPKRRGYGKNRGRTVNPDRVKPVAISLARLERLFPEGGAISLQTLVERKIIASVHVPAKLVGNATKVKFSLQGLTTSSAAKAALEKAGGSVA